MKTKRNELVFRADFWRNRHCKTIPAFEHCLCSVHVLDMQGEDDLAVPVWAGECDAAVNLALAGTVDPDFADDGRTCEHIAIVMQIGLDLRWLHPCAPSARSSPVQ